MASRQRALGLPSYGRARIFNFWNIRYLVGLHAALRRRDEAENLAIIRMMDCKGIRNR